MQNIVDTRVLKKTAKYVALILGIGLGSLAFFVGLLSLSYHLFDSTVPAFMFMGFCGFVYGVYMLALEKVEAERREEQRLVDKLIRDGQHAERITEIENKYGIKITP